MLKNPAASTGGAREMGSIPGSGRSPGGGHGNPLQYSCLEKSMDRGVWWAIVHRVSKESDTTEQLKDNKGLEGYGSLFGCVENLVVWGKC